MNEDISNTIVELPSTTIIAYDDQANKVLIDNDTLQWELVDDYMDCLTLKEISAQLTARGYDLIYVWYESGLNGYIYQYGNYDPKEWVEHGKTKGYA